MAIDVSSAIKELGVIFTELGDPHRDVKKKATNDVIATLSYFASGLEPSGKADAREKAAGYITLSDEQRKANLKQYVEELSAHHDRHKNFATFHPGDENGYLASLLSSEPPARSAATPARPAAATPVVDEPPAPAASTVRRPTRQQIEAAIARAKGSSDTNKQTAANFLNSFWISSKPEAFLATVSEAMGNAIDTGNRTVAISLKRGEANKISRRDFLHLGASTIVGITVLAPIAAAATAHTYLESANQLEQEATGGNLNRPPVPRPVVLPQTKDGKQGKQPVTPRPADQQPLVTDFGPPPVELGPDPARKDDPTAPHVLISTNEGERKIASDSAYDRRVGDFSHNVLHNGWAQGVTAGAAAAAIATLVYTRIRGPLLDHTQMQAVEKGMQEIMHDAYMQANPSMKRSELPEIALSYSTKIEPGRSAKL